MALIGDLKPYFGEISRLLRTLVEQQCGSSSKFTPIAGTSASNPVTIPSGYTHLIITKTDASGTVTITFPDSSTYVLSADGEQFEIAGNPKLGSFTIALASGATYKYFAY